MITKLDKCQSQQISDAFKSKIILDKFNAIEGLHAQEEVSSDFKGEIQTSVVSKHSLGNVP